jgi:hypothetical protein
MNWKPQDWVEHASFGLGRVSESRGDRLDIEFINSGAKTILTTTELKRANPPSSDFKFTRDKRKSGASPLKGATRRPRLVAEAAEAAEASEASAEVTQPR